MKPTDKSRKWLLSGIVWLTALFLSLALLIAFYGRDSIFLTANILGIIPTAVSFVMCVSFIMYLIERKVR